MHRSLMSVDLLPLCPLVMELLVAELNVLLKLLDRETLSSATEEKKHAVRNLLKQLKPSGGSCWEKKEYTEQKTISWHVKIS